MTKRIVSGIFILTALGALGVILAGALSSGEQLIVRFLTAVVVAALGLYVISDLRLDADRQSAGGRTRFAGVDVPANSTAAFMATVTSKDVPTVLSNPVPVDADRPSTLVMSDLDQAEDTADESETSGDSPTRPDDGQDAAVIDPNELDGVPLEAVDADSPLSATATPDMGAANGDRASSLAALFSPKLEAEDLEVWGNVDVEPSVAEDHAAAGTAEVEAPADALVPNTGDAFPSTPPTPMDTTPDQTMAAAEFEYSGDLEATGCDSWPPAETASIGDDLASTTKEEPSETFLPHVDLDQPIPAASAEDDTDGLPAGPRPQTMGSEFEDQAVGHDEDQAPAQPVNGAHRALPAPLTAPATSDYVDAPLAPIIDLRTPVASDAAIQGAIDAGEIQVIAALIEQGMLSVDGPISDRDVRTMVYVAFTSNELRKLLLAGGRPDMPNPELDLGPVELFPSSEQAAPAQTLPVGLPIPAEARTQLG